MLISSKAINPNMNASQSAEPTDRPDRQISNQLILEASNVVAGYVDGVDILQGANLSVYEGELVTVIGSNGAGKSTFAKAIFGLVPVRSGEILFGDRNLIGLKPEQIVRQGISYVPQVSNVFPSLSVSDNLDMGAYTREGNIAAVKDKIYTTFPVLAKRRNQRAGTLSGGERQMLAMGRALMLEPKLLILDEPSAAMTFNFTNLPTDNDKVMTVNVLITQGSSGFIPTTLQVGGTNQPIRWPNNAAPTPTSSAGKIDIFTFTFLRSGGSWIVFGNSNLNY